VALPGPRCGIDTDSEVRVVNSDWHTLGHLHCALEHTITGSIHGERSQSKTAVPPLARSHRGFAANVKCVLQQLGVLQSKQSVG
jgi:hypothetical protein